MEVLPAAEATLVEGISLQKYLCVFVFYFYVTLVYGKSDHFEDMELELECRIFQPSMSPGYIITGMQSDYWLPYVKEILWPAKLNCHSPFNG